MRNVNYGHLLYFWTVVKQGSVARAADSLFVTPQTISGQLKQFESTIGERLYHFESRRLVLTETGRLVFKYAEEIFTLGTELSQVLRDKSALLPEQLNVGITDAVPKLAAYRVLTSAFELEKQVRLICREGSLDTLLGELALHKLDLIISESPVPQGLNIRAFSHPLGDSGVTLFATAALAPRVRAVLEPQERPPAQPLPLLLPRRDTHLRRAVDAWIATRELRVSVVAECDDSALMGCFGQAGRGAFPAPSALTREVCEQYQVEPVAVLDGITEHFYAITGERLLKHPAVLAVTESARRRIFSADQQHDSAVRVATPSLVGDERAVDAVNVAHGAARNSFPATAAAGQRISESAD